MTNEMKTDGANITDETVETKENIIVNGGDGYMFEAVVTDKPLEEGQAGLTQGGKTYTLENPTLDLG